MSDSMEVKVPDIGDFNDVPVIDILVKPGDNVKAEDALITLESDKATMDVPSPFAGTVKELLLKIGDKVSEGTAILTLAAEGAKAAAAAPAPPKVSAPPAASHAARGLADVRVPDIGDFKDVPVIDILVRQGDTVKPEDALVTLESDKATMDVPAPLGGTVQEIRVKVGDKVSEGSIILCLATGTTSGHPAAGAAAKARAGAGASSAAGAAPPPRPAEAAPAPAPVGAADQPRSAIDEAAFAIAYASPAVRKLAREQNVDLGRVRGSGPKGRILKEDVDAYAKGGGAAAAAPAGAGVGGIELLPWPKVDFAKFGPVEAKPLSRIKKIAAANLHRNWVMIPHVTTHDEADITELEAFRVQLNKELEKSGVKVSMLAFLIKAAVTSLKEFPDFNASLEGDNLILKRYYHIGFAADTPNGLVVPVLRDADQKGVVQIAKEMGDLAKLARDGKLKPDQMQGGSFTISSLGGIGSTYFTPIINAPEVAIMGVCKSFWKFHSNDGKTGNWRLMLPLSLSWDHRVIDGAAASRFNVHYAKLLADMRRVLI
jgi:pyruvate dehydrogenase E2 component (dihydrolipoamide acetyltransferase)